MKNLRTGQTLTAALTLSILALTSPALAQEGSGREVRLTFSQGLEFSDNPELTVGGDSGTTTRTSLGLEFSSETRTQFLSFELGTDIVGEFGGWLLADNLLDARAFARVGRGLPQAGGGAR